MGVTIHDIAKEAGVGKSTISRVINGTGYVSAETVAKVRCVMERHNYHPSAAARNLSKRESDTVGLVLPEVNNPFFADILKGVSQMVEKCGYTLVLCGSDNDVEKDYRALRAMYAQRVKGLIYVPASDYADNPSFARMEGMLKSLDCPVVLLDRPVARMRCDCVMTDNFSGAYEATEALIRAGHTRIGVIAGDTELFIGRERYEGFLKAMEQNGLAVNPGHVIYGQFDKQITYGKVSRLLDGGDTPTAFFVSNNLSEAGFLAAVYERGLRIPEDVAFVGFDSIPGQDIFNMPYSSLEREVLRLGEQAAQLLFRRFDAPGRPTEKVVILPHVCLRGSERLVSGR